MTGPSHRDLARQMFAAFGAGQDPSSFMSEDITIAWPQPLPYAGEYQGKAAIFSAATKLRETWDLWDVSAQGYFEDPETGEVIVLLDVTGDGPGGRERQVVLERVRFDAAHKVTRIDVFHSDPVAMARAAGC